MKTVMMTSTKENKEKNMVMMNNTNPRSGITTLVTDCVKFDRKIQNVPHIASKEVHSIE